jgi:hypothetical protein
VRFQTDGGNHDLSQIRPRDPSIEFAQSVGLRDYSILNVMQAKHQLGHFSLARVIESRSSESNQKVRICPNSQECIKVPFAMNVPDSPNVCSSMVVSFSR